MSTTHDYYCKHCGRGMLVTKVKRSKRYSEVTGQATDITRRTYACPSFGWILGMRHSWFRTVRYGD
jgi:hypothetical protein